MDKYQLVIKNPKVFSKICGADFQNCELTKVILIPEANRWEISLIAAENIAPELLHKAEVFLNEKYNVTAKIDLKVNEPVKPAEKVVKKIVIDATKIADISGEMAKVVGQEKRRQSARNKKNRQR